MTSYKDAGVDIEAGDKASKAAYARAAETFASRKNMIGAPVFEEGGYGGLLDMGDFYLVQSDDSTGTKIDLATEMKQFDSLGFDLLAMVADDVVCTGAEVISVSDCLDVPAVDPEMIDALMKGLSQACLQQKIVIPAGEIAEVPGAVRRGVWSATAIGIVAKDRTLKPETIAEGDVVIGLRSRVARSNGFSLIRRILLESYGAQWHAKEWKDGTTWGEIMLSPSIIYHDALLSLLGRYGEDRLITLKGLAHITGGGIPSKLRRVLKKSGLGAVLDDLWEPHPAMVDLVALGNVAPEEAYRTWNMGTGMLAVVAPDDEDRMIEQLKNKGIEARRVGTISSDPAISLTGWDGSKLSF